MMGWNRLGACSSVLQPSMVVSCVNYTRIVVDFPASSRHRSRCRRMDGRATVQATGRATRILEAGRAASRSTMPCRARMKRI